MDPDTLQPLLKKKRLKPIVKCFRCRQKGHNVKYCLESRSNVHRENKKSHNPEYLQVKSNNSLRDITNHLLKPDGHQQASKEGSKHNFEKTQKDTGSHENIDLIRWLNSDLLSAIS